MLTQSQQKRIWENMLSAEIRANYFADLANRYRWHQRLANWLTLFFSSGAVLSIVVTDLAHSLPWLRVVLTLLTAALSCYSVVAQNYDRAMSATDLHARWNKLAKDYETIWENLDSDDAVLRLQALEETATELSKVGILFPYRRRKMLKWQDLVEQHHASDMPVEPHSVR